MKQFQLCVVSKVDDDGQRLLYQLDCCKDKAMEAVEECIMLPPSAGYRRARDILKRLFGRPHEFSRASLQGLMGGSNTEQNEAEAMSRLAIMTESCPIALEQVDYTADLNFL
ncbi:unnamed protein product [Heterobilharzia americana]|nr:unnamed protein product [Heterobilharzia americana]